MKLKTLLCFVFLIPGMLFAAKTFRLEDLFEKNGKLMWELNQEQFRIVSKLPLHSQDKHDNILRFYSKDTADRITLCSRPVPEVIFNFNKRRMQSVVISVYNRGDNGVINENEFNAIAAKVEKYIADLSKNKTPVTESRKFDKFRVDSMTYKAENNDFIIRRNRRGRKIDFGCHVPHSAHEVSIRGSNRSFTCRKHTHMPAKTGAASGRGNHTTRFDKDAHQAVFNRL